MIAFKKKYIIFIETIKDIDLRKIKKKNKFIIVYRRRKKNDKITELIKFRNDCKLKLIKFYIANDVKLASDLKSDGIYISAFNKILKHLYIKNTKFEIIGSAHNVKEVNLKKLQNCKYVIFSRLFFVNKPNKQSYLGVNKFNKYNLIFKNLIPLGGIKLSNLNMTKMVRSEALCILSEVKKKPTIISRLF